MEHYTSYHNGNKYRFVDNGSHVIVYVNDEKWGVPQGDIFLRVLMQDIKELKDDKSFFVKAYTEKVMED